MVILYAMIAFSIGLLSVPGAYGQQRISGATQDCLNCHATINPGIVSSWQRSRHAEATPAEALKLEGLDRKVSSETIPEASKNVVVGCAECHTIEPGTHADTFEHNGYDVHVVVSSKDCNSCHAVESEQYSKNIMAHAYGNLVNNSVYKLLTDAINSPPSTKDTGPAKDNAALTEADSCLYCHGTKLAVTGVESRETEMGPMDFPVISGWPNQGVGRINTDGSRGACAACHPRHEFSMEAARKPYTCKECHTGPDVPAIKVYDASKHGNVFSSENKHWDFKKTKWTVGRDFTAPTCATCHISLLVNTEGKAIVNRTHEMKDRLPWRIFGIVYAHPHPRNPDTTIIRNKDSLPLPTDFGGGFADKFLFTKDEAEAARKKMQSVCLACHAQSWVDGHWGRFLNTIQSTNAATLTATDLMRDIWKRRLATNHENGGNPFDESIERVWTDIWLFYANSIRFSSAMAGGGDYGVFADGRYQMRKSIQEMKEWGEKNKPAKSGTRR
ncbi:MAG: multiheme c-type cytochrome [Syntrophobacteraceae bacterium]